MCCALEQAMAMPKGHAAKHGHALDGAPSPTYRTWARIIQRCSNPKHASYPAYGGRGIWVDLRWLVFSNFLADMGEKPDGYTLDRIDNNGHYTKDNCRWALRAQQDRNKQQTCFWYCPELDKTLVQRDAAAAMGVHENTLMRWKREKRAIQLDEKTWEFPKTWRNKH